MVSEFAREYSAGSQRFCRRTGLQRRRRERDLGRVPSSRTLRGTHRSSISSERKKKKILTLDQLDTARVYCAGTSEEMLGDLDWKKRGLVMDTKLYPTVVSSSHDVPGQRQLTDL